MIIHLKHPGNKVASQDWIKISKNKTFCWTNITSEVNITSNPAEVTCEKCKRRIDYGKRNK